MILYWLGWTFFKVIFSIFYRRGIIGLENLPKTGSYILAANHQSYADPPLVGTCINKPIYYIAKKELFDIPVFGWIIKHTNAFPVDRENADISAFKNAVKVLTSETSNGILLVFPEGTRYEESGLGKGKRGPVFIALSGKVPLLPAGIAGTDRALPKKTKIPKPIHIVIVFGKPFKPWEILNPKDKAFLNNVTDYLMNEVEKCHEQAKERL